jgi:hypothetical protein
MKDQIKEPGGGPRSLTCSLAAWMASLTARNISLPSTSARACPCPSPRNGANDPWR